MEREFVHLHVASGFSMRYGSSTPATLVERARAWGQPALALTDRDGLYGAIRFVQAAASAGVAPILGVDLALHPLPPTHLPPTHRLAPGTRESGTRESGTRESGTRESGTRAPVRGGQLVDPRHPRVVVLARGQRAGVAPGVGWGRLCRLVTDTHLAGERGVPLTTPDLIARHAGCAGPDAPAALTVLLGPDSDVGRAVLARRLDHARAALSRWHAFLPGAGALVIEIVCHGGPDGTPGSLGQAGRMLALARQEGLPAVLTAAVRHADPGDAVTVDILDAARRLVPLDTRHLDRVTSAAYLAPTHAMHAIALDVVQASGPGISGGGTLAREGAGRLLRDTMALAQQCIQEPGGDLGIGSVHLPETAAIGLAPGDDPQQMLAHRCRGAIATRYPHEGPGDLAAVQARLDDELGVIATLGYPSYFLTVAVVCDLIRDLGVRAAARGSGAGSLVNYLLGISGVDPMRYGLLMERFCSPLRAQLPDIDIDVESARRTEIYEHVLTRFGGERVTCVSMMDTYRVRHAIRDVGASLGLPPVEIDAIAKAFPHIRARDARSAIAELPELRSLRSQGLAAPMLTVLFDLVERLDGLPRHIALHPCGVVLSNSGLLDRTPVESSWLGFPMSQFDKDDVETLGLLKLDILGIRMQSAMAHAVAETRRVDGVELDLDDREQVPLDDEATFRHIRTTRTLGCFQIESPGQRELIGKFGPERFEDLVIDISLFRPGPVKSDMIVPFLNARHGWSTPEFLHPTLIPALRETEGVVVFHEQVLMIVAETTGVTLAQADEVRRALGTHQGQVDVEAWWRPAARARGYDGEVAQRIWEVLKAFASFGFCKAHAAAFALPTYQSAWLKTHHPAAFLAGVLTHDPGMYPKRLILDDARRMNIAILGLDVNLSTGEYRIERMTPAQPTAPVETDVPDATGYGIRLSLADVKGMSDAEVAGIVAGAPYASLADFWARAQASRPIVERLVLTGGFDALYGIGSSSGATALGRRGRVTRRDLLLHVAELDQWSRSLRRGRQRIPRGATRAALPVARSGSQGSQGSQGADRDIRAQAKNQSQAPRAVVPAAAQPSQLILDLGDAPELTASSGLPELDGPDLVRTELDILGLDASAHVVDFYAPMLSALGVVRSRDLLTSRSNSTVWVAGVKVATQTPPIRSGRRVIFLTVDDGSGPVDATFFEDVQGPYAERVFHSWLLLVRGVVRRTGARGISLRATGAWELSGLWQVWSTGGLDAVADALAASDHEVLVRAQDADEDLAPRRVLVHASGYKQSPYADIKPAGGDVRDSRGAGAQAAPRKLWHASPGSAGH